MQTDRNVWQCCKWAVVLRGAVDYPVTGYSLLRGDESCAFHPADPRRRHPGHVTRQIHRAGDASGQRHTTRVWYTRRNYTHTHCCTLLTYLLTYLRTGGPPGCATSQSRDTLYIYTFLTIFHLINITCTKELIKNRLITKSADSKWGPWDRHMSITAVTECCMEQSSVPCTMRRMSLVAVPALLCAMHRYTPESLTCTLLSCSEPRLLMT